MSVKNLSRRFSEWGDLLDTDGNLIMTIRNPEGLSDTIVVTLAPTKVTLLRRTAQESEDVFNREILSLGMCFFAPLTCSEAGWLLINQGRIEEGKSVFLTLKTCIISMMKKAAEAATS